MSRMDKIEKAGDEPGYVTVDLPVRISTEEFARLSAAAQAGSHVPVSPFREPEQDVVRAIGRAIALIALRKRREQAFGADLFGEPSWDILLDLFVARTEGRKTSATSAAIASRAPMTTALRYIALLERRELIRKRTAEHDMRVHYVSLTDTAYRAMIDLLGGPAA